MCSWACSLRSGTKATRCGSCSRKASRRRMPSRRSIAGSAKTSAPMRCCTSEPTARSNSCRASKPDCRGECWPDRLIGDLPNFYIYASNNPSEGTLAKRRTGAALISYLTPPVTNAGLYRGLVDLKASLDRWRALEPDVDAEQRMSLAALIQAQAAAVELASPEPALGRRRRRKDRAHSRPRCSSWNTPSSRTACMSSASRRMPPRAQRCSTPRAFPTRSGGPRSTRCWPPITKLPAIVHALDGGYLRPAPGGDLLRNTDVLPTGRNLHGFDPFRHSERVRGEGRRTPGRTAAVAARRRGAGTAGDGRHGAVGHRQPQDRGRPDRPGAVADGCGAAARQLRPPRGRATGPARSPRACRGSTS